MALRKNRRWPLAVSAAEIAYRMAIPREIVEVFECLGFVRGGKSYRYDTMQSQDHSKILAAGAAP